jgi:hypothetical protein
MHLFWLTNPPLEKNEKKVCVINIFYTFATPLRKEVLYLKELPM